MSDIDLSALQAWLDDPRGPVSLDMRRRAEKVASAAKRRAPVDLGRLRDAIHVDNTPRRGSRGGPAWDVVAAVRYALVVHDGRRPGARMPPQAALRPWARRHGVAGAELLIARAIGRRGIQGRPFLVDALPAAVR